MIPASAGQSTARYSSVIKLTFFCGLFGFILGSTIYATWQNAVESSQALAGIVSYPSDNIFYLYHVKAWTILHQIPALFLRAGVSEITLSIIMSGIVGMISFQALGLTTYVFSRHGLFSFLLPFFILHTNSYSFHSNYPIMLLGSEHTYGMSGLSMLLLSLAWIGLGYYRTGAFLMGLTLSVHVVLGAFGSGILLVAGCLHSSPNGERGRMAKGWLAGFVVIAASYLLQQLAFDIRPFSYPPAEDLAPYMKALITYWDAHRMPVELTNAGVLVNLVLITACSLFLFFLKNHLPSASRLLLKCLIVAAAVGGIGVLISWLPPDFFSPWVLATMPSRVLNINGLALAPVLLGIGWRFRKKPPVLSAMIVLILFFLSIRFLFTDRFPVFSGPAALMALLLLFARRFTRPAFQRMLLRGAAAFALFSLGLVFFRHTVIPLLKFKPVYDQFINYSNDTLLKKVSESRGLLLSAGELNFTQLITRRPIVIAPYCLDILPYAPGAGPMMAKILKDIYGIDFFNPPDGIHGSSSVNGSNSIEIWQKRTPEEWGRLAAEYGFTQVLTPRDVGLKLPLAMQNDGYDLYEIPTKRSNASEPSTAGTRAELSKI